MIYRKRNGEEVRGNEKQDRLLAWLCGCTAGCFLLRILACPKISHSVGRVMDMKVSAPIVRIFVKKNHIRLD